MHRLGFRGLLLLSICATSTRASAQLRPTPPDTVRLPSPHRKGTWFDLALGFGSAANDGAAAVAGIGMHLERHNLLWNARVDGLATSWDSELDHYALLVGRANSDQSSSFKSISAGLGFIHRVTCEGDCGGLLSTGPTTKVASNTIGVSVVTDWALRHGDRSGVGIGLTSFANLNPEASFFALVLNLSAGRWR